MRYERLARQPNVRRQQECGTERAIECEDVLVGGEPRLVLMLPLR